MKNILTRILLQEDAETRIKQIIEAKETLSKWLARCPEGKIHVVTSKSRIQYYLRKDGSDKSGKYISKEKSNVIRTYLQKSYNEKAIKILNNEILLLKQFIQDYTDCSMQLRELYSALPFPARDYILPIDLSDDDYVKLWKNATFTPKEIRESQHAFITDRSEIVRSKTELNIANILNSLNIPYRYECPLEIRKGQIIHPDFTVLNVRERKTLYWEHRGMMDDREYAQNSVARIKDFASCGIYPGKGLIITEETLKNPLGTREIRNIIQTYLT